MQSQGKQSESHAQKPLQQLPGALQFDKLKDKKQIHVFGVLEENCHLLYS